MYVVVRSLSHVQLFVTPWTAAQQASLSFTISWSLLKFTSIESVMLSNRLIICPALLLLPSIFPSIKVFSNESTLCIRWPKYWSFSFSHSNEYSGLIFLRMTGWISIQSKGPSGVFSSTTINESTNSLALSLLYGPTLTYIYDYWKNLPCFVHNFTDKLQPISPEIIVLCREAKACCFCLTCIDGKCH